MEPSLLSRIIRNLKEQEENLIAWLRSASIDQQQLRLGGRQATELQEHLQVLGKAIQKAETNELGLCTVCHERVESHWLETNYTASVCLTHLTDPERSKLESELELSQKVQQGLLPQTIPAIAGWDLAAFSQPASIVGGDYFDFLRFRDGAYAVIIADAMGKGLPASLLMASLQASLRIIVPENVAPHEVLERLNRIFLHNIQLTKFVTIVILRIEPDSHLLHYANGGHNPPLVVGASSRARGHFRQLNPTGAAIGLTEQATFTTEEISVDAGDAILLYTDGVVESHSATREMFGDERLKEFLSMNAVEPPSILIQNLRKRLQEFAASGPLFDDTTMVAVRKK